MGESDLQIAYGGMRMCWRAVSERGRAWAKRHADRFPSSPEGVECLAQFGEDVVCAAIGDGLIVKAGDVEVSLW